jgi:hypothetical protein
MRLGHRVSLYASTPVRALLASSELAGLIAHIDDRTNNYMGRLNRYMGITAILALFSSCAFFSHQPTGHISVKAVSWKLVKEYAEPEAGLVGHKVTIIDPLDGRVVGEKLTDSLGYAIFDVPAGSYTIEGIGGEPQNVVVPPGQTVGFKLIVH